MVIIIILIKFQKKILHTEEIIYILVQVELWASAYLNSAPEAPEVGLFY